MQTPIAPRKRIVETSPLYVGVATDPIPQEIPAKNRPNPNIAGEVERPIIIAPINQPTFDNAIVAFRPNLVIAGSARKLAISAPIQNIETTIPLL